MAAPVRTGSVDLKMLPNKSPLKVSCTTRFRLKTVTFFAVLIVLVGVHSAFSFFNPLITPSFNPLDKYQIYDPMLKDTNQLATYRPDKQGIPYGRILSTKSRPRASRVIKIVGMTANIPEDHHVVLVVDVEAQHVCFPKWPFIASNVAFLTEIYDSGAEGECTVSLYAVDEEYYRKITTWLKQKQFRGMPLIPLKYRLDGMRVLVGEG